MTDPPRRPPAGPPALEIPDLDLSPSVHGTRAQPRRQPASRPHRSAAAKVGADTGFDEFDEFAPGSALPALPNAPSEGLSLGELGDTLDEFEPVGPGVALDMNQAEPGQYGVSAPGSGRPLPTGATPDPEHLVIDPTEAELLGDYGPVGPSFVARIAYAVRVLVRRHALKSRVEQLARELARAEHARDELLAGTLQGVLPELEADERTRRLVVDAVGAEAVMQERSRALAQTDADYAARAAELERQKVEIGQALEDRCRARDDLERACEVREQDWQRAEARMKRLGIELRNAEAPGAQADTAQLGVLSESMQKLLPEVEGRRQEAERARLLVQTARGEVQRLERKLDRLERQRRSLDQKTRQELGTRGGSVHEARAQVQRAWADAARAVLAVGDTGLLDDASITQLRACDDHVLARAREREKHVRAMHAYDHQAVTRGYRAAVVALLVLCALVLWAKAR